MIPLVSGLSLVLFEYVQNATMILLESELFMVTTKIDCHILRSKLPKSISQKAIARNQISHINVFKPKSWNIFPYIYPCMICI